MKKLKFSATVTVIMGFMSVMALIFMFLALSDIAHGEEDLSLEWRITGIGMIIIASFVISAFFTIGLGIKYFKFQ
jgi:hypothetical protein